MTAAEGNIVLEAKEVSAGYGETPVLKGVSFPLSPGEIVTLIGKSGCGKSTFLKTALGLMPVLSGRVTVFGTDMSDREAVEKSGVRKKMGVLFQRGALLNSMTVGENVAVPLETHAGLKRKELPALAREKLRLVEMEHAFDKFPTELSGGMVERAALARALALDPPLLLCDEPSAGLDPVMTKTIDQLLLRLRDTLGLTVLVVTHDILSIERIADRVVMLDSGAVAYDGSLKETRISNVEALRNFFLAATPEAPR